MDEFKDFSATDWLFFVTMMIAWFHLVAKAYGWFIGFLFRRGWRWWNRKDGKALAMDSLYEAFKLDKLEPGNTLTARTEGGLIIQIHREKVDRDA